MFVATQEIVVDGLTITEGSVVEAPTVRMKELGLVKKVQEAKAEVKAEKPKAKKPKAKKVEEVQEELLTEVSAPVEVQVEEEIEEPKKSLFGFGK